ncbi:GM26720 [Drosophila sechellia]|uniref:GM11033 n=1 Tax=Drosophila sechellia TaxID=7238 RepID=B4IM50_DROSE|nr:GM11033 [Drosophila sechellia]EDW44112.1 GM26720 [Drosophila sechellia]
MCLGKLMLRLVVSDWQLGESQNESTISTGRIHAEYGGAENIVNDGDADRDENDHIDRATKDSDDESAEDNPVRVGPGRPKLINTGKPGRPIKQHYLLGAMVARDVPIPLTYAEAMKCEYASQWREAMQCEYDALVSNKT